MASFLCLLYLYTCEVRPLRIVVYSQRSPSHLLLSIGTNSLVLKITLKYYGGDHKTPTKNVHSQSENPKLKKPILTKQKLGTRKRRNEAFHGIKIRAYKVVELEVAKSFDDNKLEGDPSLRTSANFM